VGPARSEEIGRSFFADEFVLSAVGPPALEKKIKIEFPEGAHLSQSLADYRRYIVRNAILEIQIREMSPCFDSKSESTETYHRSLSRYGEEWCYASFEALERGNINEYYFRDAGCNCRIVFSFKYYTEEMRADEKYEEGIVKSFIEESFEP
jgi:hypothetical protein